MKTYMAKPKDIEQKWFLVDAKGRVLGRLASEVAKILRGKHKPTYTPHLDTGDFVIVVNADKVKVTGKKEEAKLYARHSTYPGGLKVEKFQDVMKKAPEKVLRSAVKGMLPKVYFYEKESDKISRNIKRKLFHDMDDLKLSQKIHLRYFALHIETISDKAESLADFLSINALKFNL